MPSRSEDGTYVRVERLIDKYNDIYREVVTDVGSGQVVHECHEPLSEHQDHGSAKPRNDDARG